MSEGKCVHNTLNPNEPEGKTKEKLAVVPAL